MKIVKNKTGICFGGGGALGFAHLGVLKALEEYEIYPYYVSGASMGSIIAALYAEGYASDEIIQIVEEHKVNSLTKIMSLAKTNLKAGLSGNQKVENLLRQYIPHSDFNRLKRPLYLSVVNFRKAESMIVSSGNSLIEYMLASISVPLVFEPEIIGEDVYIDGGIMNNLPVEPLIPLCEKIIGVDVHTAFPFAGKITKTNILPLTYRIMMKQMNASRVERCRHYLSFPALANYEPFDFDKFTEIYQIGYEGASEYIQQHPDIKHHG